MQAALKVLQLKAARTGGTKLKVSNTFKQDEIECMEKLNLDLEGNTQKQKNPYNHEHLSWASWIIARLGGWSEFYNKERPPGNKTFRIGLEKFDALMIGYQLRPKSVC